MPFTMSMPGKLLIGGFFAGLFLTAVSPQADALGRRDEQGEARRAMLDGQIMPFSILKRRADAAMGDATYLGPEFLPNNRYRLKYVKDGQVVWIDVDGRTGDIIGRAR